MAETAPEVFDLDVIAREVDTEATPFTFVFGGETFTMVNARAMEWRDQLALDEANPAETMQLLLGDEQFARFATMECPAGAIQKLIVAWGAHHGVSLGEDGNLLASSVNTGKPSKPTSNGSTASRSRPSSPAS